MGAWERLGYRDTRHATARDTKPRRFPDFELLCCSWIDHCSPALSVDCSRSCVRCRLICAAVKVSCLFLVFGFVLELEDLVAAVSTIDTPLDRKQEEVYHSIPPAAPKLHPTKPHVLEADLLVEGDERVVREQGDAVGDLAVLDALDVGFQEDESEALVLVSL